jgi:hypothetical protein
VSERGGGWGERREQREHGGRGERLGQGENPRVGYHAEEDRRANNCFIDLW